MQANTTVVNVAEIASDDWCFVEPEYEGVSVDWHYYSASVNNWFERIITRPKVGRYRACLQACFTLKKVDDLVISHLPRTSHWQSIFMSFLGKKNKHLAFAFNFTDLPVGRTHKAMIKSFKHIDHFVVFSQFERQQYAEYFYIPMSKIHHLHWAMNKPTVDQSFCPVEGDYYCAVGGEGRDYHTLIDAFRMCPEKQLVIVTRPHAVADIDIPNNVKLFYNLPSTQFWSVVEKSRAVIVPLLDEHTACGHITLVGAMTLGKAIISSFSHGTTDYIVDGENGIVVPPRDIGALLQAVNTLDSQSDLVDKFSSNNFAFAEKYCHPRVFALFIQQFVEDRLV